MRAARGRYGRASGAPSTPPPRGERPGRGGGGGGPASAGGGSRAGLVEGAANGSAGRLEGLVGTVEAVTDVRFGIEPGPGALEGRVGHGQEVARRRDDAGRGARGGGGQRDGRG